MAIEIKNTLPYQLVRGDRGVNYRNLLLATLQSRFFKTKPMIAWLLCGNKNTGSSRIHGINISRELNRQGVTSYIIQEPQSYEDYFKLDYYVTEKIVASKIDVVMFQRVHRNTAKFVQELKASGKKCIFIMADYFPTEMPRLCDHVIVISDVLKNLLVQSGINANKITTIPDAVETDYSLCKDYSKDSSRSIKVVWVGNANNWEALAIVKEALMDSRFATYELITISDHKDATKPWRLDTIWKEILDCDIAVIPADTAKEEAQAKSNNRLTMFKALGVPVICSPLSMYRKVINNGANGFFAESLKEWAECLYLLGDRNLRKRIGLCDRDRILQEYGLPQIAERYKETIMSVMKQVK